MCDQRAVDMSGSKALAAAKLEGARPGTEWLAFHEPPFGYPSDELNEAIEQHYFYTPFIFGNRTIRLDFALGIGFLI